MYSIRVVGICALSRCDAVVQYGRSGVVEPVSDSWVGHRAGEILNVEDVVDPVFFLPGFSAPGSRQVPHRETWRGKPALGMGGASTDRLVSTNSATERAGCIKNELILVRILSYP